MNSQQKNLKNVFIGLISVALLGSHNDTSAQSIWGKVYDNYYDKKEAKGNYSVHNDGFIVTGHSQTATNQHLAYLLETNQNGNVTWQTHLGDDYHHFFGQSVIEATGGGYVVVGKTNKNQADTLLSRDSCPTYTPYFNAFIAYINPNVSSQNWYYIFGDHYLHDEAVEVIEDQFGNFVVTGTARGYLSTDTCGIDTGYASSYGNDRSGVLLTKFDPLGNLIFNEVISDYRYDRGVSVIDEPDFQQYLILVNRRDSSQNNLNRPLILVTDYNGNFLSATEYDQMPTLEKISSELVKFKNGYVIIGNIENGSGHFNNSFFIDVDGGLNVMNYAVLQHPYYELLVKDILVDDDTLVVSGNAILPDSLTEVKVLFKMDITEPIHAFVLIPLVSANNITHYTSHNREDNTNFCFYPYEDSLSNSYVGYHLFGNSNDYYFDHVKADHQTISLCYEMDSIGIENGSIPHMPVSLEIEYLDTFEKFELIASSIFEFQKCDTIDPGFSPFAESLAVENSEIPMVKIYPNPGKEMLHLDLGDETKEVKMAIYNLMGHLVYENHLGYLKDTNISLSIQDWESGVYLVNIQTEKYTITRRFIKL